MTRPRALRGISCRLDAWDLAREPRGREGTPGPPPTGFALLPWLLMDIELPGRSGLDAAAELSERAPDCRVLILTTFGRPGYLRRAMEAGAAGFLVKDGPVEELAGTIRRVLAGETVIDPALAAAALSAGPSPLTPRECDVLAASADGATVADIAAAPHLSESTVRNYLSAAIGKTGTRNRAEALREARHQGWI